MYLSVNGYTEGAGSTLGLGWDGGGGCRLVCILARVEVASGELVQNWIPSCGCFHCPLMSRLGEPPVKGSPGGTHGRT